ncbi:MAG: hypothetical protein GM45_4785 [actinobacterium acAMD-5]|nr:MAG: hypothetical protein GM45_4785 [actinobacterium acAMD-5]
MTLNEATQQKAVRVLASAQVLSGVGVAGTVAAGSLLVAGITGSETFAGFAQTTGVLGSALMAIPLAKLTQRGGRRLALSLGYFIGSVGAVLAVLGGTYRILVLMLMGTFLVGAASAAGYQARFAAVDLATKETRAKQLSFVVWGSTIGAVAGPNLMQPAGSVALSIGLPQLVGPYLLSTIALGLGSLTIFLFLRPDPYLLALKNADQSRSGVVAKHSVREALAVVKSIPEAKLALTAIVVGHIAMVSVMVMTPVHMAHVDVSLVIIGLVISVHVAGMYAFSPIVGKLTDKFGRHEMIIVGVSLLLLSSLISGFAPAEDSRTLGIGLFLLGLGWSCTLIAGSTLLSESVPVERKAATQGASDLVMNLGGAFGGASAGVIIAFLSYGWLCLLASIPVALLGVMAVKLK